MFTQRKDTQRKDTQPKEKTLMKEVHYCNFQLDLVFIVDAATYALSSEIRMESSVN